MNENVTSELAFQRAVGLAALGMLQSIAGTVDPFLELFDFAVISGSVKSTWRTYFPDDGTKSVSTI